jgi:HEAT repeat protein
MQPVPARIHDNLTPRERVEHQCASRGRAEVVDTCVRLLGSQSIAPAQLRGLVGPAAERFLDGRRHDDTYWLRVWGARGLLWSWEPEATTAIEQALGDDSWRVREMAAKVIARHLVADLLTQVAGLSQDPVPRVRAAAARAVAQITQHGS